MVCLKCGRYNLDLKSKTYLMGILNITPDSFYDGGRYSSLSQAEKRAIQMEEDGADIIDIGGVSTRPGSIPPNEEEETERVIPLIKKIIKQINIPLSIDTYRSEVARKALDLGISMVNDVTALNGNKKMAEVVAEYNVPVILMHMKGEPFTMQENPYYKNVIQEIGQFFKERIRFAVSHGIKEENILLDPGIGFGKRLEDNLEIIRELKKFGSLGKPIVIGVSRKSFIGKVLDLQVEERLFGTAASVTAAIMNGANILRVHDIAEMSQIIKMTDAILKPNDTIKRR
ncbi:MAG: dihydropteroate synthase [Candidatus Ratteibacteria bacterium]|nr:dihydropteroate synthase [Candidatus Ratteibacteria bacterium]